MKDNVKIDDYTLLLECGRGSFGTVYLAKDSKDRVVALKVISLLGNVGDRELQALEIYKKCSNYTHMLQIYDIVKKEGPPPYFYYTMDPADNMNGKDSDTYIPCTLAEVLKSKKTLTACKTYQLISQILQSLAKIHETHLVHRDIKPANIFFIHKCAKLGDIGLLANEHSITCNAGSPGFMPPADSGIDLNSTAVDLFAITRLIYVCLSGNPVNRYPEMEPTDDIMKNGKALLTIMNLSNEKIAQMNVRHFQILLHFATAVKIENDTIRIVKSFNPSSSQNLDSIGFRLLMEKLNIRNDKVNSIKRLSNITNIKAGISNISFLDKLPDRSILNKPISRLTLIEKMQYERPFFLTILIYVHQIVLLNKISESTTGIIQKNVNDEIQFFLIDFLPPPVETNVRIIRDIKIRFKCFWPKAEFVYEFELIKAIDKMFPYQIVFIMRIPMEKEFLYQIWHGHKKVLMKDTTVDEYIHSDWLYEQEVPALNIDGENYSEIENNLIKQIKNAKAPVTLNTNERK